MNMEEKMSTMKPALILLIVALLGLVIFSVTPVQAHDEKNEKEKTEKIPNSLGAIWHEVKEHQEELQNVIKAKQLAKVHEIAFHIRDLVNAMPAKSANLAAENLSKVKSYAKFVATLAGRLDESGDANDQAGTEENYKKLADILKNVEAQYPAGALKYEEAKSKEQ